MLVPYDRGCAPHQLLSGKLFDKPPHFATVGSETFFTAHARHHARQQPSKPHPSSDGVIVCGVIFTLCAAVMLTVARRSVALLNLHGLSGLNDLSNC
jgi:hypothetical protein